MSRVRNAVVTAIGLVIAGNAVSMDYNNKYRLTGDIQAMPVQVFDYEESVYVQVRDPIAPPAVVSPQGPVPFKIRGHYLVFPKIPAFELRLGGFRVDVVADGATGVAPGVVSINRPVDALAATAPAVARSAAAPAVVVSAREQVTGDIEVGGSVGLASSQRPMRIPSGQAVRSVSYAEAAQAATYAAYQGLSVSINAGGTVAGAEAASSVRSVCDAAGAICRVDFNAGEPGVLSLEIKEMR